MDKPLDQNDFNKLRLDLQNAIDNDKKYWRINEIKCDAIHTSKSYEEFSNRVAAAHLRPLEKSDKIQPSQCKTIWNSCAHKTD